LHVTTMLVFKSGTAVHVVQLTCDGAAGWASFVSRQLSGQPVLASTDRHPHNGVNYWKQHMPVDAGTGCLLNCLLTELDMTIQGELQIAHLCWRSC
jgi:hypothetical protein